MSSEPDWAITDDALLWLPAYRIVLFNAPGEGFRVTKIDASDDEEALRIARSLANGSAFELWDALVMLGRYDPSS